MSKFINLPDDYIENRFLELKKELEHYSAEVWKNKVKLPQLSEKTKQFKHSNLISKKTKDFGHIDNSSYLKYLNSNYDIISAHTKSKKKYKKNGVLQRIKDFIYLPLIRRLANSLLSNQREFNSYLVRFLNQLANHVDTRDDQLANNLMEVEKKFDELINEIINKVLVTRNMEMVERVDILFSKLNQEISNIDVTQHNFWKNLEKAQKAQTEIYESLNKINQDILLQRKFLADLNSQLKINGSLMEIKNEVEKSEPLSPEEYLKFEETFRGNSQVIAKKQSRYLPYFKDCKKVLDVGCGKGDFLQLLKDNGIGAFGVDSNQEMVSYCRGKRLEVIKDDVFHYLHSIKDASLDGIFACQFIEHIEPDKFEYFIQLGHRKLEPHSFMVVETINPACSYAFLNTFILDLTHKRAIHPLALKFLFQLAGFKEIETIFLSAIPPDMKLKEISIPEQLNTKYKKWLSIFNRNVDRINKLFLSHQEYAVIGKKLHREYNN